MGLHRLRLGQLLCQMLYGVCRMILLKRKSTAGNMAQRGRRGGRQSILTRVN